MLPSHINILKKDLAIREEKADIEVLRSTAIQLSSEKYLSMDPPDSSMNPSLNFADKLIRNAIALTKDYQQTYTAAYAQKITLTLKYTGENDPGRKIVAALFSLAMNQNRKESSAALCRYIVRYMPDQPDQLKMLELHLANDVNHAEFCKNLIQLGLAFIEKGLVDLTKNSIMPTIMCQDKFSEIIATVVALGKFEILGIASSANYVEDQIFNNADNCSFNHTNIYIRLSRLIVEVEFVSIQNYRIKIKHINTISDTGHFAKLTKLVNVDLQNLKLGLDKLLTFLNISPIITGINGFRSSNPWLAHHNQRAIHFRNLSKEEQKVIIEINDKLAEVASSAELKPNEIIAISEFFNSKFNALLSNLRF